MRKITILTLFMSMFLVACNDNGRQLPQRQAAIVCAADVKECADGSIVTRNPNNECEFDLCQCKAEGGCAPQIDIK